MARLRGYINGTLAGRNDRSATIKNSKLKEEKEMKLGQTIIVSLATMFLAMGMAVAQNYEEDIEQSSAQIRESMEAMGNFVKDVTFDENDIQDMITYWER